MFEINHKAQVLIIKHLLFSRGETFTRLNDLKMPSDKFNFHLKRLVRYGLIEKKNNEYFLTKEGLKKARKIDIEKEEIINQPQVSVAVFVKNADTILVIKRKRDPYQDYYGLPTTKVRFFETFFESAERCLKNEIKIYATKFKYLGIVRKLHKDSNDPVYDRIFHIISVEEFNGDGQETKESIPLWIKAKHIKKYKPQFPKLVEMAELCSKQKQFFREYLV